MNPVKVYRFPLRRLLSDQRLLGILPVPVARRMYRKSLNHGSDILTGGKAWFLENFPGRISRAIDVGLNHGLYSLELLQHFPDAEILGFEAVPEFAQYCADNLPSNIKVIEQALSNVENGPVYLFKKGGGANASPEAPRSDSGKDFEPVITNSSTRLDSYLTSIGSPRPDFIKIDTDGFDLRVLEGAEKTLMDARPVVQLEMSRFWEDTSSGVGALADFVNRVGYVPFILQKRGLMSGVQILHLRPDLGTINLILWPQEST